MAITSERVTQIGFSGDITATISARAASNASSPGKIDIVTLASGANTITPPTGGSTPKSCTIIPPSDNTNLITLKGVSGDTGIGLHLTDPTTVTLNTPTDTFVLNAAAQIIGVRLVWA